jgi:hypothetical protein
VVKSEALTVAKSAGWLDSFKKKHNIVWSGVCGESKDVNGSLVSEYKPKLIELISPHEPKNIYNADETGLLFFWHNQQNQGEKYTKLKLNSMV